MSWKERFWACVLEEDAVVFMLVTLCLLTLNVDQHFSVL